MAETIWRGDFLFGEILDSSKFSRFAFISHLSGTSCCQKGLKCQPHHHRTAGADIKNHFSKAVNPQTDWH